MKTLITAAAALVCLSSMASAEVYKCEFRKGGGGGWIRPVIMVNIDQAANTASVRDDLTNRSVQGWYDARLTVNNKKRFTIKWTYKDETKDRKNQSAPALDYRMTIVKSTLKANAIMEPRGYSNHWNTGGKCAPVKK